jgi:hypothetical protein
MNPDSVRSHPKHDLIAQDLAAGQSLRVVADRYGVSKSALDRYKNSLTGTTPKENTTMTTAATETKAPQTAAEARAAFEAAQANLAKLEQAERENAAQEALQRNKAELESIDTAEGTYRNAVFSELDRLATLKGKSNSVIDAAVRKLDQAARELVMAAQTHGPKIIGLDKAVANDVVPALDAKVHFWGGALTPELAAVLNEAKTRGIDLGPLKRPWILMPQQYAYDFQTLPEQALKSLSEPAQAVLKGFNLSLLGEAIPVNLPEKPAPVIAPTPEPVFTPNLELIAKVQRGLDLNVVRVSSRPGLLRMLETISNEEATIGTREAVQQKLSTLTAEPYLSW